MEKFRLINRNLRWHFLIIMAFVIYLFGANYLFDRVFTVNGEAELIEVSKVNESDTIQLNIEGARDAKREWKDLLEISGWGFIRGLTTSQNTEMFLVLKSGNDDYAFKADVVTRPDITQAFKDSKLNLNYSGFSVLIAKGLLDDGEYKIGLLIKNNDNKALTYGSKTLVIKNGSSKLR